MIISFLSASVMHNMSEFKIFSFSISISSTQSPYMSVGSTGSGS